MGRQEKIKTLKEIFTFDNCGSTCPLTERMKKKRRTDRGTVLGVLEPNRGLPSDAFNFIIYQVVISWLSKFRDARCKVEDERRACGILVGGRTNLLQAVWRANLHLMIKTI